MTTAISAFPAELRNRKQWCGFRIVPNGDAKPKKIPVIAATPTRKAKSNDPATWGTLDAAIAGAKTGAYTAVGYALNGDFVGIDLDGERWIVGDSELTEEAQSSGAAPMRRSASAAKAFTFCFGAS